MASGICYTQSGTEKRYEDEVSISLVKGTHNLPTIKNDVLSVANENHYSFEVSSTYIYSSKGDKVDNMPLIFVTYYPSSGKNPCYFNFNYKGHTVKIILYYLWPNNGIKFEPFNKNYSFNVKINKPDGSYYNETIKSISDCTLNIIHRDTIYIENISLGFDLKYHDSFYFTDYSFFNYADTFILNDVKSWEITQDTTIDLYITNKRICLSPLWNYSSTSAKDLPDASATSMAVRTDSGTETNNILQKPTGNYNDYGQCAVIGLQDGDGGLFFGSAPLIPSFGYDNYGQEVGWLPAKQYYKNIQISSNGGLYYFANLVRTIPEDAQIASHDINLYDGGNNGWRPPIRLETANKYYKNIFGNGGHYRNGCTSSFTAEPIAAKHTYELYRKKILGTTTEKTLLGTVYWDAHESDKMRAGLHVGTNKPFDSLYSYNRVKYNTPDYGVLVGLKAWGKNHQNNSAWCWANPTFGGVPAEYAESIYPINYVGTDAGGDNTKVFFYSKDNLPGIVITGFCHLSGSSGPSYAFGNKLICRLEKWKEGILNKWYKVKMSE